MTTKDMDKMYDGLVKDMDKVMQDLKKLLDKQKNEEEQVKHLASLLYRIGKVR